MIIRDKCVICGCKSFIAIKTIERFPVYMGISEETVENDILETMSWVGCDCCGCVQLDSLVDLDVLYQRGHNAGVGKIWEQHYRDFSKFISVHCGDRILEIGGGNLILASEVMNRSNPSRYTVFDKNPGSKLEDGIEVQREFFGLASVKTVKTRVDSIVGSHVMEHFYSPLDYLELISRILEGNGTILMSIPLIGNMVRDGFTNSLNFEHTYYIDMDIIRYLFSSRGYEVVDYEYHNPYNVFVACQRSEARWGLQGLMSKAQERISCFREFVSYHEKLVSQFNQDLDNSEVRKFLFGGHIFSQYLLKFGLAEDRFESVLDNDRDKIGRRLYGTNLQVRSPKILKDVKDPLVVLRVGQFREEIKRGILDINGQTTFLEGVEL